jgi:SAM-dependent methyltransferase
MASNDEEQPATRSETPSKDVAWFKKDVTAISEPARRLLERYSNIPPNEVIPHVLAIRDRAWRITSYPCIGQLRFLDLSITQHPLYPIFLPLLTSPHPNLLLDLGCCFGQDLRALVAAGVPSTHLYGADLHHEFIDLGYDLLRDRSSLNAHFLTGDIFSPTVWASSFAPLEGTLHIIHTASFFHLFLLPQQLSLAKLLVRLLKPEPGVMVVGRQSGNERAGEYPGRADPSKTCWRHNEASWKEMWKRVGSETGSEWAVKVWVEDVQGWDLGTREGPGWRRLTFGVKRVR